MFSLDSVAGHLAWQGTRTVHLRPNAIEPLEWTVQTNLNPTGSARDRLTSIVVAPAFHKTDTKRAHLCQLVNGIVALGHCFCQNVRKLVVWEYFQIATGRDFANGGLVPAVHRITIRTLNKNRIITETLGVDLTTHVVESHASTYKSKNSNEICLFFILTFSYIS